MRSGWAADPSKIVELPNAYAYVQQSKLDVPAGLVAHRAAASSAHARKVGSFRFETTTPQGGTSPGLLVVLSVDEQQGAEMIIAYRFQGRPIWRFTLAPYVGDRINVTTRDTGPRFEFRWSDAAGGSMTAFPPDGGGGGRAINPFSGRFTRLDG